MTKRNLFLAPLFFLSACVLQNKSVSTVPDPRTISGIPTYQSGSISAKSPEQEKSYNTEEYNPLKENEFKSTKKNPLSTFSIDVDTASYSNIRRFIIDDGSKPPKDAVRIEEMINYFSYDYPNPEAGKPISIIIDQATCPWNNQHQLVRVGLKAKTIPESQLPKSNLVFLIDVSGSMEDPDKLPLVKDSLKLLIKKLKKDDRIAIVTYAGEVKKILKSTPVSQSGVIISAIDKLQAKGSTAGGKGIVMAYDEAIASFIKGGNNRVVLATDGDFNVGVSSDAELVRMIEEKRNAGVYLSVLGFGSGNLKDAKMEALADSGNGNYAYIDNIKEARKVLVNNMAGTLFTVAKDVKIQIEFNPASVESYRLLGYENRLLKDKDFANNKKDAGDMGSGHTVTALYEIIPQKSSQGNLLTLNLRYKVPGDTVSQLMTQSFEGKSRNFEAADSDFRFAAATALWGMVLRGSEQKGNSNVDDVIRIASGARGADEDHERSEFISLVKKSKDIKE